MEQIDLHLRLQRLHKMAETRPLRETVRQMDIIATSRQIRQVIINAVMMILYNKILNSLLYERGTWESHNQNLKSDVQMIGKSFLIGIQNQILRNRNGKKRRSQ